MSLIGKLIKCVVICLRCDIELRDLKNGRIIS
ncbi:rCG56383 [Rattus norvegicus]|uniref:RCG56383 n=1 Tax=Rattus norvegicus TaxID=10116 RepID=A6IAE9_RAT|nr:rCG56383 [Rattus norvegicus]